MKRIKRKLGGEEVEGVGVMKDEEIKFEEIEGGTRRVIRRVQNQLDEDLFFLLCVYFHQNKKDEGQREDKCHEN